MPQPAYEALAEQIAQQIRAGAYRPGDRLPSQSQLTREGHGKQVTQDAYGLLIQRGLVEGRRGAGYYVLPSPGPDWMARIATLEAAVLDLEERLAALEQRDR
ncbi:winged helix-turn-helix transcriptional regulator [Kineosporia sp. J2-2]|uniref:Winged helix-turn-helix transcriptional regulator n=1 Tax=Kineosporia corallincola TaxID=2835133 RepID=A0ABS5TKY4_9ACTN|nr:winged helix-turn-helix transcriptional regulator [Kineosporia corallincola]